MRIATSASSACGSPHSTATDAARPRSIRCACMISSSRVSSGVMPISRR
jgi:hypothetical protein